MDTNDCTGAVGGAVEDTKIESFLRFKVAYNLTKWSKHEYFFEEELKECTWEYGIVLMMGLTLLKNCALRARILEAIVFSKTNGNFPLKLVYSLLLT